MLTSTISACPGPTVSAARTAGVVANQEPIKGMRSVKAAKMASASAFGTPRSRSRANAKRPMQSEVIAWPRT